MKLALSIVLQNRFYSIYRKSILLFFMMMMCCLQNSSAQNITKSLDTLVSKYASLNWSGVLYAGNDKEILYRKSFGFADREQKSPMQLNTVFKTESVGKMFTSVRVMQLISKGKLKIDMTLAELLPEWKIPQADKIQIGHLLNHTSGLSSPWEHPDFVFGITYSKEEQKKIIETAPVAFKTPGSGSYYSNSAYMLLEEIITKCDQQSFEASIKQNIFEPAGMKSTFFLNDSLLPTYAATPYYQISTTRFVKDDTRYGDGKASGAGGWMSTAEDLYLFAQAYVNEKLLPADEMKIQLTNNHTLSETALDARLGFQVLRSKPTNTFVVGHNGGGRGFSIDVFFDVNTKHIVVFCSNLYGTGYALTSKAFYLFNQLAYPEPAHPNRVKLADWLLTQPKKDSITTSTLQSLQIRDVNEFLFFSVFDNLTLAKEHTAAEITIRACRERYPSNVYSWIKSGENAVALNNTDQAKIFFRKAYDLAEEQKNEEVKKMLQGKF